MKTKRQHLFIEGAAMYATPDGLVATADNVRFFPVQGLVCHAAPSDVEEMDAIKPYTVAEDGLCKFYTVNQAQEKTPEPPACAPEYEETDNEDVQAFVADIEKSASGCLLWSAVTFILIMVIGAIIIELK